MGKTSLLARGCRRGRKARRWYDHQKLNAANLQAPETLFQSLAQTMTSWTSTIRPRTVESRRGRASISSGTCVATCSVVPGHLVWGWTGGPSLQLFLRQQVSGLFAPGTASALDRGPGRDSPWPSPTPPGAPVHHRRQSVALQCRHPAGVAGLQPRQVWDLNLRHGAPGGEGRRPVLPPGRRPALPRALRSPRTGVRQLAIDGFEERALRDDGLFGDHLRRMLVLLGKDAALCDAVRAVLRGLPCPNPESFYRLRSAGLMAVRARAKCPALPALCDVPRTAPAVIRRGPHVGPPSMTARAMAGSM
jgi:hypothetical protein